jgi:DNA-binding transcriptional ArsR family regulator
MDMNKAVEGFDALAHETRLAVFRALVQAGPAGLAAGNIASDLGVVQNTMSSHLHKLQRAGLTSSERIGRRIMYRADFNVVGKLIVFLMEDCCGGSANVRAPEWASLNH